MNLYLFYSHGFPTDIRVLHEGGCTLHETYRALGRNAHVKACTLPRRLFEKNPICTSSNQTYENPFITICLAGGLMHARERVGGVCGNPVQKSCEKVHKIQESLKSASITERTKFLACGSDLRTYRSEHHLECSRPYNRCKWWWMTNHNNLLVFTLEIFTFYQIWRWHISGAVLSLTISVRRNWSIFKRQHPFVEQTAIHTSHSKRCYAHDTEWTKVSIWIFISVGKEREIIFQFIRSLHHLWFIIRGKVVLEIELHEPEVEIGPGLG